MQFNFDTRQMSTTRRSLVVNLSSINIIRWNNEKSIVTSTLLCRPVWTRVNDLSSKLDVSVFRRQMRALISQRVVISQGSERESPSSHRVRLLPVRAFCGSAHKGSRANSGGRGLPSRLRQWVDPARQHGQPAALLPSGNHKPAAFSSSTKTHEQRVPLAYRITYTRGAGGGRGGIAERGWWRKEVNAQHRNTIRRKIKMED